MSTPNVLTQQAKERFLSENRDLIALIKNLNSDELFKRIAAAMQLNPEYTEEVTMYADLVGQKGHAGKIAREDFSRAIYKAIAQSFLRIQRNCAIEFVCRLTPEALSQLEEIEVIAGVREPAPPPPPQKSAQEQLEDQVREDWRKLSSDKLRAKLNRDPKYKQTFDRLKAADQLTSQCTTWYDAGVEQR
jgi:hypothetical protein